ncbi:hypothetical protein GGI43DRAFT_240731 [Trichoderma evansii]
MTRLSDTRVTCEFSFLRDTGTFFAVMVGFNYKQQFFLRYMFIMVWFGARLYFIYYYYKMFIDAKRARSWQHQKQSRSLGIRSVEGFISSQQSPKANIVHSFTKKEFFSLFVLIPCSMESLAFARALHI